MKVNLPPCFLLIPFLFTSLSVFAQSNAIDTTRIRETIVQWNQAHNEKDDNALSELYGPVVLFYGKYQSKKECINTKRVLFNEGLIEQRIISGLELAFYEDGVIYGGFTKEIITHEKKKSEPSYLLLNRAGNRYLITGESDLATDRNRNFHLSLGKQIPLSQLSHFTLPRARDWKLPSLYGVLILTLLGLLAWLSILAKKRTGNQSKTTQRRQPPPQQKIPTDTRQIEQEKGLLFEKFVVNRFRQSGASFKWIDATSDKWVDGYYPESNMNPDLQFEFRTGSRSYPLSVECKYRSNSRGTIFITTDDQRERYKAFANKKKTEVFLVLGLGGTPDEPSELFVIPLPDLQPKMARETLDRYKAQPTFIYNPEKRRLY
jgi:hypothetical protein